MEIKDLILKKHSSRKIPSKEATEILKHYGLATSQQSIQRYIREGELKVEATMVKKDDGSEVMDKRIGYRIMEASLYKFIVKRIPAVGLLWNEVKEKK